MALGSQAQNRDAQGTTLRRERHVSSGRKDRRKRRVQSYVGTHVEQPHAVGADHPHTVPTRLLDEGILPRAPLAARLREAGRNHNERLDAGRGAIVDRRQDGIRRDGDDREIDVRWQLTRGAKGRTSGDLRG